ncbi:hypothetical protein V4D30_00780 [Thermodesulfovibrio sp. 3907-1M]|uniref:Uncharacterized protein n=1 Tax=Thermodesulfovibrio autotrophicus TaxID=3118333 RepID=A0AAU8GWI3_9BACT
MIVKFLKSINIKIKDKTRFYQQGQIVNLPDTTAEFLTKNGFTIMYPKNTEQCIHPFVCEIMNEKEGCAFIQSDMKNACCGPYKKTQDGGIISHLGLPAVSNSDLQSNINIK